MDYKHYYKTDNMIGTGNVVFRHYSATPPETGGKSRFVQFLEGALTELIPEDFGDITVLPDYALYWGTEVTKLEKITMPDNITTLGVNTNANVFNCTVEKDLTIVFSEKLNYIKGGFGLLVGVKNDAGVIYDFSKVTKIPTLNNSNSFNGAKEIRIPASLYDDWIKATNWSEITNADKYVAV